MEKIFAAVAATALVSTASMAAPIRPSQSVPTGAPTAAAIYMTALAVQDTASGQTAEVPREGPPPKKKKRRFFGLPLLGAAGLLGGSGAAIAAIADGGSGSTDPSPSP